MMPGAVVQRARPPAITENYRAGAIPSRASSIPK
jgi:hypothetical protein